MGAERIERGGERGVRILVIDNYDSFAYNLVQYLGTAADEVVVFRNDAIDAAGVRELDPDGVVVSPGPGTPDEAGVSIDVFRDLSYPTLGVCLGHQALCAALGAPVGRAPTVVHGKRSRIQHDGRGIFAGLPGRLEVGRYHSLSVDRSDLPPELVETARTADERAVLMGVRRRDRPHVGVQFHPESVLTECGERLIENFVAGCVAGGGEGRSAGDDRGSETNRDAGATRDGEARRARE
ncbi:MAG: aminodeoxychorismate/anthranilate synthase component II [Salinigranum sp.]